MAQKVTTTLTDDLDDTGQTVADETIVFGLDGTTYQIDLSEDNAAQLRDLLGPYVQAGRKAVLASSRPGRSKTRSAAMRRDSAEVRAWARLQGIEVSERGRIPAEVIDKFNAAH